MNEQRKKLCKINLHKQLHLPGSINSFTVVQTMPIYIQFAIIDISIL
ncbi:protein of unknown function [Maridesulfovibrio hydrothermalis AM13 = DSM 14728]|uniref:Uncharacterized protein n=1 Tax=Maridesulfovibrio hydrothermalis AM13 = DSM 14728 TaxID=1121451 RepID=L0RGC2_9BACT|nr:protein of unknown function [Maridesulfovibrio hydrothermalis AM13 = DSM 14728]